MVFRYGGGGGEVRWYSDMLLVVVMVEEDMRLMGYIVYIVWFEVFRSILICVINFKYH